MAAEERLRITSSRDGSGDFTKNRLVKIPNRHPFSAGLWMVLLIGAIVVCLLSGSVSTTPQRGSTWKIRMNFATHSLSRSLTSGRVTMVNWLRI